MKKILMIPYFFPPMVGARSIRMFYIARYLNKWEWKVDVLSATHDNYEECDQSILKFIPSKVNIYRPYKSPLNALKCFLGIYQQNKRFSRKISRLINGLKRKLFIPDDALSWLPFAVYTGISLISKNKYDVIFSSSFPASSHILGYILKKLYKIPWIAEYGDPWSYNPITKLSGIRFAINRSIEKLILKKMDRIIFMTEKTKQLYLEKFDFLCENKISVIHSGYEPSDYLDHGEVTHDKFTVLYTGVFYRRRIDLLFSFSKAVNYLSSIMDDFHRDYEILIIGRIKKKDIPFLPEKTTLIDHVNFFESLNYMKKAFVLLLLGNEGGAQIPSKVYHYIGAKRPILVILGDEYDPLKECLSGINRAIIVKNSEKEIVESLAYLYRLFKSGTLFKSFDFSDVEKFTWEYSLRVLDCLLKDAI